MTEPPVPAAPDAGAGDGVLAVLLDPAGAEACLRIAAEAAMALPRPAVTALHVRSDPAAGLLATEEVLPEARRDALAAQADADAAAIHATWQAWRTAALPSHWEEVAGVPADVVAARGPAALVVMITLPREHAPLAERAALDAALFTPGRPVLVIPSGWNGRFGHHLALGWRDTASTRHAVRLALPWLRRADHVTLLHIGTDDPSWPDPDLLGLPAERVSLRIIDPKDHDEGDSLLAAVAEAGADGLVMGAYRRSRVMEWILGGVTRHVLHAATIPLLMVH